ncbi:MAG: permease prefix domain 1-containing protein [Acidimicrobiia bacterium]
MAHYALIDGYLDTMRSEIRWRKDLDDVVSEMEDHLYSTVEGLLASGAEPQAAQQTTLDRFGEPEVLKAVYASTPTGGIAVPTKNTIRAGTFALVAGGLWLISATSYALTNAMGWDGFDYWLFSAAVLVAGVLGLLAMIGVGKRLGGLGLVGMVGLVITGLGVVMSFFAWAVPAWMGLQGVGMLVFGIAVLGRDVAPKWATLLVSSGFIIGVIAFFVGTAAEVGEPDSYGDYPVAWQIATVVGTVLVAVGFIGWGLWLRSEEAVDIDSDNTALTA